MRLAYVNQRGYVCKSIHKPEHTRTKEVLNKIEHNLKSTTDVQYTAIKFSNFSERPTNEKNTGAHARLGGHTLPSRHVSPESRMTRVLRPLYYHAHSSNDTGPTSPYACRGESCCAVPNHSYICIVELPLTKGVCKDTPWQVSAMAS